jgi:outer membrane protein assembly factor BamB
VGPHRILALLGLFLSLGPARADWPGWRGPRGNGVYAGPDLPLHWGPDDNITWKVPVPGVGHSSPVVSGEHVFVTTCIEEEQQRLLLCYSRRNGKLLWQRVVLVAPLEKRHARNTCASSTPATDGKHVWVTFLHMPDMQVACYTVDGNLVWRRSPGKYVSQHGFCSSPVLYKDLVICVADQEEQAFIVALDRKTGAERWRIDRPNCARSFSTPLIQELAGRTQMVLSGSKCVAGYDPESGKPLWQVDTPTEKFVAGVACADGVVLATGTSPSQVVLAIRPDGRGNVTRTHVQWQGKRGAAYVPSPVAFGRYFFLVADNGDAHCWEARSGKVAWTARLGRLHVASPLVAGPYVYALDDEGTMHILKAGDRFEVVARNELGEPCQATPALSQGQIFIRAEAHLYCIGTREQH